ncbi:MAG: P-II family nitrogen regulator [Bacilli bacterium]|nr:P-II family nitrogen regulator [Bacilli bacterium]MDD4077981.1 P-II family nitrogen regulator [Bacilli bacterium]MDD4388406.1 P-II family nitrogen regulator [Bacilli bacterium]
MKKELIVVIVDKHKDADVMRAATAAGATGGTIMHGRGTGIYESKKFFGIEIEPEKEIVLIIANVDIVPNICEAINRELKLEDPNRGILFTLDLNKVIGIRD